MNDLVSIIIPTYNAEKYLDETITSVLNQTYNNLEVIIVNDGSTDSSSIIAKEFVKKNDRIKYIEQKNSGVSIARNTGIKNAKGEYLAFLDADDIWQKDNLEKKIKFLDQNSDYDWIYSNLLAANENLEILGEAARGRDDNILENILLWEGEVVPGPCSNIVIRRKCVLNSLQFDPKLSTAADQMFCIELASKYKAKILEENLVIYRIIGNSMSRNIAVMERDHILVYKKVSDLNLFKNNIFKLKCFSNLYLILAGSWWINGKNKRKGMFYLLKSVFTYPPNILKLFSKILPAK